MIACIKILNFLNSLMTKRLLLSFIGVSIVISVQAQCPITEFTIAGGGTYCAGDPTSEFGVILRGTQSAYTYKLYKDGVYTNRALSGNDDWSTDLVFKNLPVPGTFTVGAVKSGCTEVPSSNAVTYEQKGSAYVNIHPSTDFNFCEGATGGVLRASTSSAISYQWYERIDGTNRTITGATSSEFNPTHTGYYCVKATNSCGSATSPIVKATMISISDPTVEQPYVIAYNTSGTLSASGAESNEVYRWYTTSEGGSPLISTTTPKLTVNTTYYVTKYSATSGCESTPRKAFTITVNKLPTANAGTDQTIQLPTSEVTLNGSGSDPDGTISSYSWSQVSGSPVTIPNNTSPSVTIANLSEGTYVFRLTVKDNYNFAAYDDVKVTVNPILNNYNYIIRNVPLVDEKNGSAIDEEDIDNLSISGGEMLQSITYFNGLGWEMQQVMTAYSTAQKDMVTPIKYDEFGRQAETYLLYESDQDNGNYKKDAVVKQKDFYTTAHTGVVKDSVPFGKTAYESSPLNRVSAIFGSGKNWHDSNKKVSYVYRTNTSNEVRKWLYKHDSETSSSKDNNKFYNDGVLYVTETTDEQNSKIIEYKDKQDRIILRKTEDKSGRFLFTYYLYDDFDNLRMVIPPKACEILDVQDTTKDIAVAPGNTTVKNLCFTYDYDARKRMISKQVPGALPVYMVYDKRDRLRLTQDGTQSAKNTPEWTFTKYDALNRPVMTGILSTTDDRATLQEAIDGAGFSESRQNNATGYSQDGSFPTSTEDIALLSITYYDDYTFTAYTNWDIESHDYGYVSDYADAALAAPKLATARGQITGSKVKILGQDKWLNSVSYYDERYRVIQAIRENHLGGFDRVSSLYDFTGNVLKTKRTHHDGNAALVINEEYLYDHANRLKSVKHQTGDNPAVTITQNEYNALGELINKELHSKTGSDPLQSVDYRYNIRGWLQSINQPDLKHDAVINPDMNKPSDLFGIELLYERNTANLPVQP